MMFCSIACLSQDRVSINRDSLFNVLLNLSELKVENAFLKKKNTNQKVIIVAQEVIISETEFKTEILTKQIEVVEENAKNEKLKAITITAIIAFIGGLLIN